MSYEEALKRGGFAVVTGAASGVGKAAAIRFVQAELNVVLIDLPGEELNKAESEIREIADGKNIVSALAADVSNPDEVNEVAAKVFEMGEVAVLMNNAGIARPTSSWENLTNWKALIEVNLFGVLHGMHAFLPRMIEAKRPAIVINTGSKQGITTPPGNPGYNVSKAGVKVATEMLAHDLREIESQITAHLFIPGFTYTGMIQKFAPEKPASAWTSEEAVDFLLERVSEGDFYVLCPDNDVSRKTDLKRIEWALGDILENRPPLSRWHPIFEEVFAKHEKDC